MWSTTAFHQNTHSINYNDEKVVATEKSMNQNVYFWKCFNILTAERSDHPLHGNPIVWVSGCISVTNHL